MQPKLSYNNAILDKQNTDSKIDSNILPNYKKRRDTLNQIVKNHIERQKQNIVQKNKHIAVLKNILRHNIIYNIIH